MIAILLLSAKPINAQIDSYAKLELHKELNFWQQSANAAGAWLDTPLKYSSIDFGLNYTDGEYHRSMDGTSQRDISFNSEGAVLLHNHYLFGKFNYVNRNIKGAGYNASLIDPYRGMPYGLADLNHSDWKNQYYDMGIRWASPKLFDHLSIGLDLYYSAHSGAKQRDIRADNKLMHLNVRPGVVWSFNAKHHIGGFFNYYTIKEESANSNVNTYISQEYYELNGLGNSVKQLGAGRSTNYTGDNFGGGLNYGLNISNSHLLISAAYNLKAERAEDSFTTPRDVGAVRHAIWETNIKFYTRSSLKYGHLLAFNYLDSRIKGIEYITERTNTQEQAGWVSLYSSVRSKYNIQNLSVKYDLIAHRADEYSWKLHLGIDYIHSKDTYLYPRSEKQNKNILSTISLKRNIAFKGNKQSRLLLTGEVLYNKNLSGDFYYGGENSDYITVQQIEQVDFNYYNTNFWGVNTTINYSQKFNPTSNMSWSIKAYFDYNKANKFEFNHRKTVGIALGCIF